MFRERTPSLDTGEQDLCHLLVIKLLWGNNLESVNLSLIICEMGIQLGRWLKDHKHDSTSEVSDFVVKVQKAYFIYTHAHIYIYKIQRGIIYIEFDFDLHFIYQYVKELFLILTINIANSMKCSFH